MTDQLRASRAALVWAGAIAIALGVALGIALKGDTRLLVLDAHGSRLLVSVRGPVGITVVPLLIVVGIMNRPRAAPPARAQPLSRPR